MYSTHKAQLYKWSHWNHLHILHRTECKSSNLLDNQEIPKPWDGLYHIFAQIMHSNLGKWCIICEPEPWPRTYISTLRCLPFSTSQMLWQINKQKDILKYNAYVDIFGIRYCMHEVGISDEIQLNIPYIYINPINPNEFLWMWLFIHSLKLMRF